MDFRFGEYDDDMSYQDQNDPEGGKCCPASKIIPAVAGLTPVLFGIAVLLFGFFDPCNMEIGLETLCSVNGTDYCCETDNCDVFGMMEKCEEVRVFGGFLFIGLGLVGVGVLAFVLLYAIFWCRNRKKAEEDDDLYSTDTKSYKREKNAYTVTYDTYPPTYHSHGPQ